MKIRRHISGVLCSFLDAYASRYSDYDGYWIFGLLIREGERQSFDLLHDDSSTLNSPIVAAARQIAQERFLALLGKARIPKAFVSEVKVHLSRLEPSPGAVNGRISNGYRVSLAVVALSDLGKCYNAEKIIFVAPHNPADELRSTRTIS